MSHVVVVGFEHYLGMLLVGGHVDYFFKVIGRKPATTICANVHSTDSVAVVIDWRECVVLLLFS